MTGSWGRGIAGGLPQAAAGWRLAMAVREPGQAARLGRFRKEHPDVIIGDNEFGTWQARIGVPDGEQVFTRHVLRELLDRLDEFFDGTPEQDTG